SAAGVPTVLLTEEAKFEREFTPERTIAGRTATRPWPEGGRLYTITPAQASNDPSRHGQARNESERSVRQPERQLLQGQRTSHLCLNTHSQSDPSETSRKALEAVFGAPRDYLDFVRSMAPARVDSIPAWTGGVRPECRP